MFFIFHELLYAVLSLINLFHLCLEATEEVSLDSPEREPILSSDPSPAVTPVTPTALIAPRIESKSLSAPVIFDRSREEVWRCF